MSQFRLINDGYSFKKIVTGKKWVGRVVKHATEPRYLGIIGNVTVSAATETAAFREVVAKHLGFASAAALADSNAQVRAANRAASRASKARARHVVGEFYAGNYDPLFDLLAGPCGKALRQERMK